MKIKFRRFGSLLLVLAILFATFLIPSWAHEEQINYADEQILEERNFSNGYYYLNNASVKLFLWNDSGTISATSGTLSQLGYTSICWEIRKLYSGEYVLHPLNAAGDLYLAVDDYDNVILYSTNNYREYPERCLWDIIEVSNGIIIKSLVQTTKNKYLYCTISGGLSIYSTTSSTTPSSSAFVWRNTLYSNYQEWTPYTQSAMTGTAGVSFTPNLNPYGKTWADYSDFSYAPSSTYSVYSIRVHSSGIVPACIGLVGIVATHKVTGQSLTFSLLVSSSYYGSQMYRQENSTLINCHGYAANYNGWPQLGAYSELYEFFSITFNSPVFDINYAANTLNSAAKADFQNWLSANSYSYEEESAFYGNGSYRTLMLNQYRIVLRTGCHIINNSFRADYHFWYQVCDGSWANKHGSLASEWLTLGTTPDSTNTSGWAYLINNFYDMDVYSFIITIS